MTKVKIEQLEVICETMKSLCGFNGEEIDCMLVNLEDKSPKLIISYIAYMMQNLPAKEKSKFYASIMGKYCDL